jgi:glutamine amidotransferase-like uncharacterized protein
MVATVGPARLTVTVAFALASAGCPGPGPARPGDGGARDAAGPGDGGARDAAEAGGSDAGSDAVDGSGLDAGPAAPRVAVFDDTAEPDGSAWAEGLDLVEAALDRAGLRHDRLDRASLNRDPLALDRFGAVVFGGGFAYPGYTLGITATGKERLRAFVAAGGVLVGICAGAYMACDDIVYEGEAWGDESGYDLDLFPGTCTGPLESVASYPNFGVAGLDLSGGHPAVAGLARESVELPLWYAAGPWFETAAPAVEVVARYSGAGLPEAGRPAIVALPRGEGLVLLFGPHPEVVGAPVPERAGRLLGEALLWALEGASD